jgi:hypothetical protein
MGIIGLWGLFFYIFFYKKKTNTHNTTHTKNHRLIWNILYYSGKNVTQWYKTYVESKKFPSHYNTK